MPEFKLTARKLSDDGKHVFRTGKIFNAGEYKDKGFTMTPEEIIEAEANFSPVQIDLEHHDNLSFVTGKLGTLESIVASEDGEELFGTVKIPLWLDDLNDKDQIDVSCTWGKEDKLLKKLAFTDNPRVSDAALFAAFTANEVKENPDKTSDSVLTYFNWIVENEVKFKDYTGTYDGLSVLQGIHNQTARAGAICTEPPKDSKAKMAIEPSDKVEFVSKEESAAIQKMHDLSTSSGGQCYFMPNSGGLSYYSKDDSKSSKTKEKKMTLKERFNKFFDSVEQEEDVEVVENAKTVDPEVTALKTQVAQLSATIEANAKKEVVEVVVDTEKEELKKTVAELSKKAAEQEARVLNAEATAFAESVISENKLKPESKAFAVEIFKILASDDKTGKVEVKFSDDKTVDSRIQLFKDFVATIIPHNLTKEELIGFKAGVLNVKDNKEVATDAKKVSEDAKKQAKEFAVKFNKGKAKGTASVDTFSA